MNGRALAVTMAQAIVDMDYELQELRVIALKYEELRAKYDELLMGSIEHNEKMLGGLLEIAMKPGVIRPNQPD